MITAVRGFKMLAAMSAVLVTASGAFAQDGDTAYVPFVVNVDATVTARQDGAEYSKDVTGGAETVFAIPLGGTNAVWNTGGTQGRLNAPAITGSRGNITLRLPPQSYRNAEISLHSVNGKRILSGKAAATEAASVISRRNVAAGVYVLSVKGLNGDAFTTRLTHSGGKMNINAAFGAGSLPQEQRLSKSAAAGDWEITVAAKAAGYNIEVRTLNLINGDNPKQTIDLTAGGDGTTFTDSRDGKTYKKVTIGTQTWMGENLNYDVPNVTTDVCYDNKADSCAKYGRLYNWSTAMNGSSSSSTNPSGVRGVCPVGWHLPSDAEWDVLMVAVGGVKDGDYYWDGAGTKLKSTSSWYDNGNGTDQYGFSALPGGYGNSGGYFYNAGSYGFWWSATEYGGGYGGYAWYRYVRYDDERVRRDNNNETYLYSVRCVQD